MGINFCGALAYADDIVLIAPTVSAMRKMLSVCESSLLDLIVCVRKWRSLRSIKVSDVCQFYLDGKPLEFVESYLHLGNIITNTSKDSSDIVFRRGRLVYCVILVNLILLRLLKCSCYILYGCELWDLDSGNSLDGLCSAWRKGVRRALGLLLSSTHSFLIPSQSCTLPLFEEICKRSACFLNKCIFSSSCLVRSVMLYSINSGRYNSVTYRNLCTVCKLFNWSVHDYISGRVCLT